MNFEVTTAPALAEAPAARPGTLSRTLKRRPSTLQSKARLDPATLTFSVALQPFMAADVAFLADSEWSSTSFASLTEAPPDATLEDMESGSFPLETTSTLSRIETPTSLFQLDRTMAQSSPPLVLNPIPAAPARNFPSRAPIFMPKVRTWSGLKDIFFSRRNIHTIRAVIALVVMLILAVLTPPIANFYGPESFFLVFVVALWDFTLTVGGSLKLLVVAFLLCAVSGAAVCLTVALCSIGGTTMNATGVILLLFAFSFALWLTLAYQPWIFPPFFSAAAILYFGLVNAVLVVGNEVTLEVGGRPVTFIGTPADAYIYAAKMAVGISVSSFVSCMASIVVSPLTLTQKLHQELAHGLGNVSFLFSKVVETHSRVSRNGDDGKDSAKLRILLQSLRFDFLTASRGLVDMKGDIFRRSYDPECYGRLIEDLQDMTTQISSLNACLDGFRTFRPSSADVAENEQVLLGLVSVVNSSIEELRKCLGSCRPSGKPCSCSFRDTAEDKIILERFLQWCVKQQRTIGSLGAGAGPNGTEDGRTARAMAGYLFAFGCKELVGKVHLFRQHLIELHSSRSTGKKRNLLFWNRGKDPAGTEPAVISATKPGPEGPEFLAQSETAPKLSFPQKLWTLSLWMRTWEARFALKFSIAVCFITLFAFIPATRPGFYDWRVRWAGITFYAAAAPTHSGDISNSLQRTAGTVIGAFFGIVCWYVAGTNPYGICAFSVLFWYPACWVKHSGLPDWTKTGALSAATYTILFNHMESINMGFATESVWVIGGKRALMVVVGVFGVMFVGRFVWPSLARVQLRESLATTVDGLGWLFRQVAGMYMLASAGNMSWKEDVEVVEDVEAALQTALIQERVLVALSTTEPRFRGPFPEGLFLDIVRGGQHILDMLRTAREALKDFHRIAPLDPKKLHVEDRDRISRTRSLVMLNWMCSRALRTHSSLPYYLPDCSTPQRRLNVALLRDANAILVEDPAYLSYGAYSTAITEAVFGFQVLADLVSALFGRGEGVIGQLEEEVLKDV